jgi:hypothetical protein
MMESINSPRERHIIRVRREENLQHDRIGRKAALEVLKVLSERPRDVLELSKLGLLFPGLSYALEHGWVTREHSCYIVSNAGLVVFSKLEVQIQDPHIPARVLLKARAVGGFSLVNQ